MSTQSVAKEELTLVGSVVKLFTVLLDLQMTAGVSYLQYKTHCVLPQSCLGGFKNR